MSFQWDDVGTFPDEQAAQTWARNNGIATQDFMTSPSGKGVRASIRRSTSQPAFDHDSANRRDGF
ncbi:hypothetical protein [Sphingomonas sp. SKA58]|jgi:hypothetical protein|uniref:hypothetical protein n=1 Tax=Sphingomonas sp. (strain SKA58) TaxID=314266 RepID=UPI0012EAE8DB|nr:hypothetical protein [Sphingomonas sp. SKA58]